MSTARKPKDSPAYWMVLLDLARSRDDYDRAAQAQRELARLGVKITYSPTAMSRAIAGKGVPMPADSITRPPKPAPLRDWQGMPLREPERPR